MFFYLYILFHHIVVYCTLDLSCTQTSVAHLKALLAAGTIEIVYEIPFVVQLFRQKIKKESNESLAEKD